MESKIKENINFILQINLTSYILDPCLLYNISKVTVYKALQFLLGHYKNISISFAGYNVSYFRDISNLYD